MYHVHVYRELQFIAGKCSSVNNVKMRIIWGGGGGGGGMRERERERDAH